MSEGRQAGSRGRSRQSILITRKNKKFSNNKKLYFLNIFVSHILDMHWHKLGVKRANKNVFESQPNITCWGPCYEIWGEVR